MKRNVPVLREFAVVRSNIVKELKEFVMERIEDLLDPLLPMTTIKKTTKDVQLRQGHRILIPDTSLEEFVDSYRQFSAVRPDTPAREALKVPRR